MKLPKIRIKDTEFAPIYGSRKVTKDAENVDSGFYGAGADVWVQWGDKIKDSIPDGYLLFGEIVGFLKDGRPIQAGYTYDLPAGESELYIYRVATISPSGVVEDLSWDAVKGFCDERGLKYVPEMWRGLKMDFEPGLYLDQRYWDNEYPTVLPLSKKKTVDEGVVIRAEGRNPFLLKLKSPKFFEFETAELDKGTVDVESEESNV